MANSTKIRKQAKQLKGRPVCVTLHDGRSYVGWISGLGKDNLILSTPPPAKSTKRKAAQTAQVSALMPFIGSFFGGAGGGMLSGGMKFFGMMQKAWPMMKMGYNMIKTMRPMLGSLKELMGKG